MSERTTPVHLHKDHEKRLLLGHLWVFSNEIASDLGAYEPGSLVDVYSHGGTFIGRGYINPHSLINIRLLSPRRETIDAAFFRQRIEAAWRRREELFPGMDAYRLVYSEGDLLPGLIIDRYRDQLVLQTLTLGMELRIEAVCETLETLFHPRTIVARNDVAIRTLEG